MSAPSSHLEALLDSSSAWFLGERSTKAWGIGRGFLISVRGREIMVSGHLFQEKPCAGSMPLSKGFLRIVVMSEAEHSELEGCGIIALTGNDGDLEADVTLATTPAEFDLLIQHLERSATPHLFQLEYKPDAMLSELHQASKGRLKILVIAAAFADPISASAGKLDG